MDYIFMEGIEKRFGEVQANRGVNFSVKQGEVHALLGENGSGKSTLVNMLSGIYAPDSGRIFVDGKARVFNAPKDAIGAGIGMVHQHFKLVEVFTALENMVLGQPGGLTLKRAAMAKSILEQGERYGLRVDPNKKVYDMSVSEKQTVEILKVLYRGAKVLILDEPTAVLTPQETEKLFAILRNMQKAGCAIILITHKMHEVLSVSQRVTVLRKGEWIGTVETDKTDARTLTEMMVGRKVSLEIDCPVAPAEMVRPVVEIKGLTCKDKTGSLVLEDVTFTVNSGEILGVAGIAGSGQKDLCEAIAGLRHAKGSITLEEEELLGLSPRKILQKGVSVGFVPEDRLGMGLVAGLDIVENTMLKTFHHMPGLFMDRKKGVQEAKRIVEEYDVDTPSVRHPVKKLSGGNIQKVLLGREISMQPKLLVTAYPVRGLDIGASYFIYETLTKKKLEGVAVLFIGEDLDVLMQLSDRLLVLQGGRVMGIVDPRQVTKEDVGLMMLGHPRGKEAQQS